MNAINNIEFFIECFSKNIIISNTYTHNETSGRQHKYFNNRVLRFGAQRWHVYTAIWQIKLIVYIKEVRGKNRAFLSFMFLSCCIGKVIWIYFFIIFIFFVCNWINFELMTFIDKFKVSERTLFVLKISILNNLEASLKYDKSWASIFYCIGCNIKVKITNDNDHLFAKISCIS